MIEMLPDYVEKDMPLALFESWNEWGEGGQAEPGIPYGFGRLSAIRDVLTESRGPYDISVPTVEDVPRFQTTMTNEDVDDHYLRRYARSLGLSEGFTLDFSDTRGLSLRAIGGLRNVRIEGGFLKATADACGDPVFLSPPCLEIPAGREVTIVVRMKVSAGEKGQIFWKDKEHGRWGWSEERSEKFDLILDGNFHEYRIEMTTSPLWTGIIEQFRFDPSNAPCEIEIDYFKVLLGS